MGMSVTQKSVGAVETPIRTDDAHLIRQQVASKVGHHETHDELAYSTWSTTYVAQCTVFHALEFRSPL